MYPMFGAAKSHNMGWYGPPDPPIEDVLLLDDDTELLLDDDTFLLLA